MFARKFPIFLKMPISMKPMRRMSSGMVFGIFFGRDWIAMHLTY
jgi:hypothetical protein